MRRRKFLTATTQAAGALVVAPAAYAAAESSPIEGRLLETLTRIARLIYPHDRLADSVYASIVRDLLAVPGNSTVLRTGALGLGDFLALDEPQQLAALQSIEGGEFFGGFKTPLMFALYNTAELWDMIDYPGPSFPFGGYLNRGHDDIDWLPAS